MKEQLMLIFIANGAVLIIPGLNFAVLTRYALQQGLLAATQCVVGITLAIAVHVLFSMFGSYQLIDKNPLFFKAFQIFGALYICYFASYILFKAINNRTTEYIVIKADKPLLHGLMIDLLNPFVTLFYLSLFSSIIKNTTTGFEMLSYLIFILFLTFIWFTIVSAIFSSKKIRDQFLKYKRNIEVISAMTLYYYAFKLLFS